MLHLEIRSPGIPGRRFKALEEGEYSLGREAGNTLEIRDPRISAHHLALTVREGGAEIRDLGSTNGTYLEGVRTLQGLWLPGKTLVLGDTRLRLLTDADFRAQGLVPEAAENPGEKEATRVSLNDSLFEFQVVRQSRAEEGPAPEAASRGSAGEHLRIVARAIRNLKATLGIEEILEGALRSLFDALRSDTGYILLVDPEDRTRIRAHIAYEDGHPRLNLEERLYSRTLTRRALEEGTGFIFDSEEAPPAGGRGIPGGSASVFDLGIRTALCCPIHSEGAVFGLLYLHNNRKGRPRFGPEDLDLAMSIAGMAGTAIENHRLNARLRAESAIREHLRRFVSPNIAERIIAEKGRDNPRLHSRKAEIAVLFADIRGFTPLAENLDPLTVARLLDVFFTEMAEIVFRQGGTLDKFVGDSMMVLFNAPFDLPDPEKTAVRTALEMRQRLRTAMPGWTEAGLPSFEAGFGLHCGEAVVGTMGTPDRMEYTAVGDIVNLASRLCSLAKPGQILLSEEMVYRIRESAPCRFMGSARIKGKAALVDIYEAR